MDLHPSHPENNAPTPPPTNNQESIPVSPNDHLNSSSPHNTPSISSRLDHIQSLLSNTITNLLSPSPNDETPGSTPQQEEHYKAISHERHAQEFSDTGNARRFASLHHKHLRYIPQSDCWMLWDGKRWSADTNNNILTFARATIQSFRDEALALPYEQRKRSEQLFNHADRSDTPKRLAAMLDLACHDPALITFPHTFDSDPLLLNVLNGTVDLRTNRLRPHNPQDFLTHLAPVTYDQSACSPVWDKFLSTITNNDPELEHFLQRAVGYSMTTSIQEQTIFLLYGPGCNGKSTFLNAIRSLLGDYADYTSHNLITSRSPAASSPTLPLSLLRKRLLIIPALGLDRTLDTLAIEYLTGGEILTHPATASHLTSPQYTQPTFKLWAATNHLPTIRDYSPGAWRRIRPIPFPVSFQGREDKLLATKLQVSASAILNWAIQGCLTWQREGLSLPACIQQATTSYQDEQDPLACFLRTCCQFAPHLSIKANDLYQAYQRWCHDTGENKPLDTKLFSRQLLAHGYHREHRMSGNFYSGFNLIPSRDPQFSQPNVISENQRITYYDIPDYEGS